MPLEMQPLQPEDLEAWVRIHYQAFKNTTIGCLWNREPSPESFTLTAQTRGRELLSQAPEAFFFKVVDTELESAPIAVAKWHVYEHERPEDEVRSGFTLPAPFPEENRAAREMFMASIFDSRWSVLGTKPHVILESLVCLPDHHRRGAGGMLVKWGTDKADELGLLSYLEASPQGKGLYLKHGFQAIRELKSDLTDFGGAPDVHLVSWFVSDEITALLIVIRIDNDSATSKAILEHRSWEYALLTSSRVLYSLEHPRGLCNYDCRNLWHSHIVQDEWCTS